MARLPLFILSFLVLMRFDFDPDLGWHLAYGQRFLEAGEIFKSDVFSWTMPGYLWGHSYFLYQIIIAFLVASAGFLLTAGLFGIVAALGVLILARGKINFPKALIVLLGSVILIANIGVRPHTVSFLIFALILIFVEKGFLYSKKYLPLWFLIFALWANVHRAYVTGLVIISAFALANFLWEKSAHIRGATRRLQNAILVILAGVIASLITPFGLESWRTGILLDLFSSANIKHVSEWQPIGISFPLSVYVALSGLVWVVVNLQKKERDNPTYFLVGSALFMLSFLSANFIFFWVAIFIYLTLKLLDQGYQFKPLLLRALVIPVVAIFVFQLASVYEYVEVVRDSRKLLLAQGYPVDAVEALKKGGFTGGLFNEYEWGGYIDYSAPNIKVFIDGRMASWQVDGRSIFGDYLAIKAGNCELLDEYGVEFALMRRTDSVSCFSNWQKLYEDDQAVILKRS